MGHQSTVWLAEKVKPWATLDYTPTSTQPLPLGYDGYILMGDDAHYQHSRVNLEDQGYVHFNANQTPQVCTYDVEAAYAFNRREEDDEDTAEESKTSGKDLAPTQPKHWRFWLVSDISKLSRIAAFPYDEPERIITRPNLGRTTPYLKRIVGHKLVIDIETRYSDQVISCIGFQDLTEGTPPIVVPVYDYRGQLAYAPSIVYDFFRALSIAFSRNIVIGHNLAFDLTVLAAKYKVIFGERLMDTMLMHHRCFQVEKSLGHAIRRWCNFPWHKHQNVAHPRNEEQEDMHFLYNARDVHRTGCVFRVLENVARMHPCLASSMRTANDTLYEALCTTLRGMRVSADRLSVARYRALKMAMFYDTICQKLTGIPDFNAKSSDHCVKYFHKKLGYKIVKRTDSGAPSLAAKALYSLAAKYENPLLRFVIAAREAWKEYATLNFEPWKLPLV